MPFGIPQVQISGAIKYKVAMPNTYSTALSHSSIRSIQMNKAELNMNVLNKVIAYKMLEIAHENGLIDEKKYIGIERKRFQYGESVALQNKLYTEVT